MKKAGIWLDFKNAYIISLADHPDQQNVITIESDVEDFHPKGGSGRSTPYGPQDAISEQRYLERKKQQLKKYFQKITKHLNSVDQFFIFGPADAKIDLSKDIGNNNVLKEKLESTEKADIMTENQMKEWVRNHYK